MLTELVAEGWLPTRWMTCGEGYGRSTSWMGWRPRTWATWRRCRLTRGYGRYGRRLSCPAPGATASLKVRVLAGQWSEDVWTRHRVPGDSRGPEYADFALPREATARGSLPAPRSGSCCTARPGRTWSECSSAMAPAASNRRALAH